jgi:hypothetical protein
MKHNIIMLPIGGFKINKPMVTPAASAVCRVVRGGIARRYGLGPATGMLAGLVVWVRLHSSHRFEDSVYTSDLLGNLLHFRFLARKPSCYRSGLPAESRRNR